MDKKTKAAFAAAREQDAFMRSFIRMMHDLSELHRHACDRGDKTMRKKCERLCGDICNLFGRPVEYDDANLHLASYWDDQQLHGRYCDDKAR